MIFMASLLTKSAALRTALLMPRDIEFRTAGDNRVDRHIIYAQSAVKAVTQFIDTPLPGHGVSR
jgi:hypothetical protein